MFKELTDTVLGELEAVFARMQEADVRPLLAVSYTHLIRLFGLAHLS